MNTAIHDLPPVYLDTQLAMSQIGDVATMQGMLSMLEETLGRDVQLISQCLSAGDIVGANQLLHPLKGFIPIFCTESLCSHVANVEMLSKAGPVSDVAQAYENLRPELELLLSEVSVYLNEHGGG